LQAERRRSSPRARPASAATERDKRPASGHFTEE
jgi:hypothetical protein